MARTRRVSLPVHELTDRQIHLHLIELYDDMVSTLKALENHMADLTQSVDALKGAVDNINQRFAAQIQELHSALDAANEALADENLDDAATEQALTDALAKAEAAAGEIDSEVERLNAIGAAPETPVEPDPDAPVVDNTLPGDLPADQ